MKNIEPEWIVNSMGELGVKINERFFFLYKGRSIEYDANDMEEGEDPIKYRPVRKREFGESCIPEKYVAAGYCSVPIGVDFVAETSGWEDLPLYGKAGK